jgi:hypothetical protein
VINRLLVFFALVYVVEGVGQVEGLIAQPLSFYLKEVHGWTALEVSAYLTIFNFPWIIKPLYGAFSDFVPLLGYRRKPYLPSRQHRRRRRLPLGYPADCAR